MTVNAFILLLTILAAGPDHKVTIQSMAQPYQTQVECEKAGHDIINAANVEHPEGLLFMDARCIAIEMPVGGTDGR